MSIGFTRLSPHLLKAKFRVIFISPVAPSYFLLIIEGKILKISIIYKICPNFARIFLDASKRNKFRIEICRITFNFPFPFSLKKNQIPRKKSRKTGQGQTGASIGLEATEVAALGPWVRIKEKNVCSGPQFRMLRKINVSDRCFGLFCNGAHDKSPPKGRLEGGNGFRVS